MSFLFIFFFFFSSRRRHTRLTCDWSSDVCSSDLDAESLKAGMAEAAGKFPDTTLEVQHVLETDDLVAVHSRVQHALDTPAIAVVHIFRFEGDRIAELWDIGQEK